MRTLTDYLDLAQERLDVPSRNALNHALGFHTRTTTHVWEKRGSLPTDANMIVVRVWKPSA